MNQYTSNTTLDALADRLRAAKSVLLTTHAKPDGDAYGSVVALGGALRALDKRVDVALLPPVAESFAQLRGYELVRTWTDDPPPAFEPDMVVVADTGAWQQVPAIRRWLEPRVDKTAIIDHHLDGNLPAAWRLIDSKAAACCEIVSQLIDQLFDAGDHQPTELWKSIIHDALYVGIASDTGWFRFSNTRPFTHELAGRLIREGVNHASLHQRLELNERPQKLALLARALGNLELLAEARAAMMVLRPGDFEATGAGAQDTERFVDYPQVVGSVRVVAMVSLVRENVKGDAGDKSPEPVRISLRSKAGPGEINVAQIAHRFGGGGHARAAGAKLTGDLDEVVGRVREALAAAVALPTSGASGVLR